MIKNGTLPSETQTNVQAWLLTQWALVLATGLCVCLAACRREAEAPRVQTRVQPLQTNSTLELGVDQTRKATAAVRLEGTDEWPERREPAPPSPSAHAPTEPFCRTVEREAALANRELPQRLDADTVAESMLARGCAVELEYRMLQLAAADVAEGAIAGMASGVANTLCEDPPTRRVLERGGTFRSIYRDRNRAVIGDFTVALADCSAL